MTTGIDSWFDNVNSLIGKLAERRVIFLAATGTMGEVADRVWGRGETTDGSPLGYLEDYEVYAYRPPAPRKVSGLGKPNKEGKSRKIKGGYYPTYLAFKADQGRRETPFDLTGALRKDYLGGVVPTPTEEGPFAATITLSDENAAKWQGLTNSKGPFLILSNQERPSHLERIRTIWGQILSE